MLRRDMQTPLADENKGYSGACHESSVIRATRQARHELGQFITPDYVSHFMASLFSLNFEQIDLLDAGAGTGALTQAVVRRLISKDRKPQRINVTAYELDQDVLARLRGTLDECLTDCERSGVQFSSDVRNEEFIAAATSVLRGDLLSRRLPTFNAAIVNPPYRKLRSDSNARLHLRSVGIETSNFYTAFVSLIIKLLENSGELVAITPRSFCNGPYFKTFRDLLLDSMALRRLHLFESRSAAFGHDNVLQENLILHAIKGEKQSSEMIVSTSSGHPGAFVREALVPFSNVILPSDAERFIHADLETMAAPAYGFNTTLGDLNLSVSTGRVVDFRSKSFLRELPGPDTAPLIYPFHFKSGRVTWPKTPSKKPNAIIVNDKTSNLLVPAGTYVLVKRFSSKEERKRIVACVYDPDRVPAERVAFENHLNYFHIRGHGLPKDLAKGLAAFLNSTFVDLSFRQFSGHTQVNAADLRKLSYPTSATLERIGRKVEPSMGQRELDELLQTEIV
jgi:adenine-specific DNA-methyltransferase